MVLKRQRTLKEQELQVTSDERQWESQGDWTIPSKWWKWLWTSNSLISKIVFKNEDEIKTLSEMQKLRVLSRSTWRELFSQEENDPTTRHRMLKGRSTENGNVIDYKNNKNSISRCLTICVNYKHGKKSAIFGRWVNGAEVFVFFLENR